jgi:hypothetical protein
LLRHPLVSVPIRSAIYVLAGILWLLQVDLTRNRQTFPNRVMEVLPTTDPTVPSTPPRYAGYGVTTRTLSETMLGVSNGSRP